MRVADKTVYDQINSGLTRNRSDLARLQAQASTQKRVNKPSDDPLAAARVLAARTEVEGMDQFKRNADYSKSFLEYTDQSLGDLGDALQRAKELALGQANDASSNPTTRRVAAAEIRQLFNQAVQIGNRKFGDRFLFGGYQTLQAPFDTDGRYLGDDGAIAVQINPEGFVGLNVAGSFIFLGGPQKVAPMLSQGGDDVNPEPTPINTPEHLDQNNQTEPGEQVEIRGPASESSNMARPESANEPLAKSGVNIFHILKDLEIGLLTSDKQSIFTSLDTLDQSLEQVILARAQVGARIMGVDNSIETLGKSKVNAKISASELEDADVFATVNDINKAENTLKATLATSGKLIQPSLLDFLR